MWDTKCQKVLFNSYKCATKSIYVSVMNDRLCDTQWTIRKLHVFVSEKPADPLFATQQPNDCFV